MSHQADLCDKLREPKENEGEVHVGSDKERWAYRVRAQRDGWKWDSRHTTSTSYGAAEKRLQNVHLDIGGG